MDAGKTAAGTPMTIVKVRNTTILICFARDCVKRGILTVRRLRYRQVTRLLWP